MHQTGKRGPGRLLLVGVALAILVASPGSAMGSTDPTTPPPSCDSIVVTCEPSSTAPPVEPSADDIQPAGGFDGGVLLGIAAVLLAILVVASWIVVVLTGLASLLGARPLARRWLRGIAVPATFLAIWGVLMAVAFIVDIGVSMRHFDTGTPADEQALINAGLVVVAVGGAILGAIATMGVRARTTRGPSRNG